MNYELNAKICLPEAMGKAQICELNVGRYASYEFCKTEMSAANATQPAIVSYVVSALAQHFEEEDGAEVMLSVEYFIRAI